MENLKTLKNIIKWSFYADAFLIIAVEFSNAQNGSLGSITFAFDSILDASWIKEKLFKFIPNQNENYVFFLSLFTEAEFIIISFHLPCGALVLRKRPPNTGKTNSRCRVSDADMCVMKVGVGLASPIAWRVGALTSKHFFLFFEFYYSVIRHVPCEVVHYIFILITYIILCVGLCLFCAKRPLAKSQRFNSISTIESAIQHAIAVKRRMHIPDWGLLNAHTHIRWMWIWGAHLRNR